ncbi:hypothetical protein ZHAS_00000046 [Anopheles sinensis]|uniref:Uncharacterized protein n=1 Tax=Anopheles sinensis TaxID=74873 RepID=A0A084V9T4_ANOSI|nr:hypothetical protein ZHAS_00000046 [Anopheles sinensis]
MAVKSGSTGSVPFTLHFPCRFGLCPLPKPNPSATSPSVIVPLGFHKDQGCSLLPTRQPMLALETFSSANRNRSKNKCSKRETL